MSGEVIEIEVQLTVDDYAKFSADAQTTPAVRESLMKTFLGLCVYFALLIEFMCWVTFNDKVTKGKLSDADFFSYHYTHWFSSATLIPLFVLIFVYWFCFSKRRVYKRLVLCTKKMYAYGENKAFFSKMKISISEKEITNISEYTKSELTWQGIEKVQILNGDLALYTSAVSALKIPSRFFQSEEEKQRIYEQCVKWWQAAQEKPAESEAA